MRSSLAPSDSGFTLAEICVAMALIVLAAFGAAYMASVATRAIDDARVQTSTTVLASQKLEQLRALEWTIAADGTTLSDSSSNLAVEPVAGGGGGLRPSPSGTLDGNTPGYVDFLTARGEWAGTGFAPPATARYIRRWSVRPLPEDPTNTLILQVLVTTVERDRQASMPRQRLAGDALVTAVRTRRSP